MGIIYRIKGIAYRMAEPLRGRKSGFGIFLGMRMRRLVPARLMRNMVSGGRIVPSFEYGFAWRRARGRLVVIPDEEANPHMIIVGASGYGKSTLLKRIVSDVARSGRSIVLFDGHNEHEQLVRGLGGTVHDAAVSNINVFALDGLTIAQRIEELTALLSRVYNLGYLQRSALNSALYYTYRKRSTDMRSGELSRTPTTKDLVDELSIFIANSKGMAERNRLEHIRQRIASLEKAMPLSRRIAASELASGVNSFSMAELRSDEAKVIYVHETVKRLYGLMKGCDRELGVRRYVVIDESKLLMDNVSDLLASLVNEGRKFGYALVIVTNSSAMLPKDVIANSSTFIAFHIDEPGEIAYISNVIAKGNPGRAQQVRSMLERLRRNQAIVSCGSGAIAVQAPAIAVRSEAEACPDPKGLKGAGQHGAESGEHRQAVRAISARLSELRVRHYVTSGKGPDIVAYARGRVAIEYETGLKDFGSTSRMILGRRRSFDRTIVFVNDLHAGRYGPLSSNGIEVVAISHLGEFAL